MQKDENQLQEIAELDDTLDNTRSGAALSKATNGDYSVTAALSNQIEPVQSSGTVDVVAKGPASIARSFAAFALLLGIIGFSAAGGYLIGQPGAVGHLEEVAISSGLSKMSINAFANVEAPNTRSEPVVVEIADAQAIALVRQQAINDKLGEMRAELLRLHALYARLAQWTQLNDGEFDMDSPLLEWEEQSSIRKMQLLNRRLAHMSDTSNSLEAIVAERYIAYRQTISGKPVVEGSRTSGFGDRVDPITGETVEHRGLDFSGPVGEPILALADGIVEFSGKNAGYGNLVRIQHTNGLETRYAHNHANLVNRGDRVAKGQIIATLGSTGRSTGPHVHVEVRRDGSPIDPALFIR